MTVYEFVKVLLSVTPNVYHDEVSPECEEYIIWSEIGINSLRADSVMTESVIRIALDIYTKKEFSEIPDKLQNALDKAFIAYDDPEIIYSQDTKWKQYAYSLDVP